MALGFAVLLLVGMLGPGKGGVAWGALQGGGEAWAVQEEVGLSRVGFAPGLCDAMSRMVVG